MKDPFDKCNFERSMHRVDLYFALTVILVAVGTMALVTGFVLLWHLVRLGDDGVATELGHFAGTFLKAMRS